MFRSRPRGLFVAGGMMAVLAGVGGLLAALWRGPHLRAPVAESTRDVILLESPEADGAGIQRRTLVAIGLVVLAAAGLGGWSAWNVTRYRSEYRHALLTGNPDRAPSLMRRYGCAGCHTISGVTGADGRVGPPLDDVGQRVYIAGRLPNTPETLVRWIQDARSLDPHTAMPRTGISDAEARDVAAWLLQKASN